MSLHDEDMGMMDEDSETDTVSIELDNPDMMAEKPNTVQRGYSSPYTVRFTGCQQDRFPGDLKAEIRGMLSDTDREPYPLGFTGEW